MCVCLTLTRQPPTHFTWGHTCAVVSRCLMSVLRPEPAPPSSRGLRPARSDRPITCWRATVMPFGTKKEGRPVKGSSNRCHLTEGDKRPLLQMSCAHTIGHQMCVIGQGLCYRTGKPTLDHAQATSAGASCPILPSFLTPLLQQAAQVLTAHACPPSQVPGRLTRGTSHHSWGQACAL